jgi:outer membrane protein assembly factor BamD (BamD/ComL family)
MPETGYLALRFLFIYLILLFPQSYPQQYPDSRVHYLLISGIDNLINSEYNSAQSNFKTLRSEFPLLPLGDIYLASVEITRSFDYGVEYNDSLISSLLESGKNKAEILLKEDGKSIWNKYFMGLAEGYSAYYYALNESWISSFSRGLNSVGFFRDCMGADSFFEAYTAIGTYLYWKSRKLESFNWLPFLRDETDEGIKLLESASTGAVYSRYLAVNSLIWIYIDQDRYQEAAITALNILEKYPESRFFKWALARICEETDKRSSIKIYYDILNSYTEPSLVNEITIKHKIAEQYYLLGENDSALKLCREVLSKNYEAFPGSKSINSRLKRVDELRIKLLQ